MYPKSNIIIGGDFNHLNLDDLEIDFCLSTLNSPPTRGDATLDLILTNRPDQILSTSCFAPTVQSDHQAILMVPRQRMPPTRKRVQFVDYNFKGFQKLNDLLESITFDEVYSANHVDDAAAILDTKIAKCVKEAFSTKTVTISDRDPCWITPKAKWLIKRKKALAKHSVAKAQLLDSKLLSIRRKYLQRLESKQLWNLVDAISHRKYLNNSNICFDAFDADILNSELAKRSSAEDHFIHINPPFFDTQGHNPPQLTLLDVINVMRSCKRTSSGPGDVPYFVIQEFWDLLAPVYHHVWNKSIQAGSFPKPYKLANLIPLPKKSNVNKSDDIRGISITPITSRLFERCVHKKWIQTNIQIIGDSYQFAYKSKISTVDCLLTLQHHILSLLDSLDIDGVHLVMVDFSKAFDKLNQQLAAKTFPKFIHSPFLCQWLYDFIINRHQRLIWKGDTKPYLPIDLGCSQGTVGGPAIFSIYTDDIQAKNNCAKVYKYSDDINILIPCRSLPTQQDRSVLQQEISHIEDQARKKQMTINDKKTKVIRFSLTGETSCPCKSTSYESVLSTNILGITFDSNGRFATHGRNLLATLKRTL